jgi:hypothetical protein
MSQNKIKGDLALIFCGFRVLTSETYLSLHLSGI